ncbi:hypothetical protein PFMALIP_05664 [Plasmodium falciparum MaliPS096_E11]|uniref:Surface antigen n=1 Tax=Plasmodium falciparum MaliPS096_E11 TaxID=1036727 RepID=A0A024WHX0_PLAFA|nr:hypothetical protein PFMALIP_05664 [Plasmodium falciparum MaliPS096_E11]
MKVHYINILLFSLPLNILEHNPWNHYMKPHTYTNRSLCECELYAPATYDDDPQMKEVMVKFIKQTQQRFHEYDERMKTTRQKCKEKCDKEIQKIILKDKLEKELMDKFATLQTDIQNDAIPTCICEKSITDKVEKTCLKCGGVLGGGIAPTFGLIGSVAINMWKTTEIAAVIAAAEKFGAAKGAAAGAQAGINAVMNGLLKDFGLSTQGVQNMGLVLSATNYSDVSNITTAIFTKYQGSCMSSVHTRVPFSFAASDKTFCFAMLEKILAQENVVKRNSLEGSIQKAVKKIVTEATTAASTETAKVTASETETLKATNIAAVEATYASGQTAIIVSIAAINF